MRKLLICCGAVLVLSLCRANPAAADPCGSVKEAPGIYVPDQGCYEIGVGYEYQHFDVFGTTFHNNVYNANVSRHLFDWLTGAAGRLSVGAEVAVNAGFGGNTSGTPSLNAKSLFVGAGPHLAIETRSRLQPWVHGLVGLEHFRFTQTNLLGSNNALGFMVGGGVDVRVAPRLAWRVEGDFVGTKFSVLDTA